MGTYAAAWGAKGSKNCPCPLPEREGAGSLSGVSGEADSYVRHRGGLGGLPTPFLGGIVCREHV